jgi:protein tyrosine/serine phosphatase/predicted nucleotidyltransferase
MQQLEIITKLKQVLFENAYIESAILYGSFARKTANVNSDIDIALIVTKDFSPEVLINKLEQDFNNQLKKAYKVELRSKIVLYFIDLPKSEMSYSCNLSEISRNYLGSEIPVNQIANSILFDKTNNVLHYLESITNTKILAGTNDKIKEILNLTDKFVYEFENCSNAHRRGDGYHFYFFYNIALQIAIQLNHYLKGYTEFNFLPKRFTSNVLNKDEIDDFYSLRGSLFLPDANKQKRKLLQFFYNSIQGLIRIDKQKELIEFCEWIYDRDFLWNFRDISLYNSSIKKGLIYRTASLTLFQNESFFESFIHAKKIGTVIDLRAEREVKESGYNENSLKLFKWIHASFDPWNQSLEFQNTYYHGTDIEIAYMYFTIECKNSIKKAIESILKEENSIVIHCFAGKDRTGILVSILHLLSGADLSIVYDDYLASESDTKRELLNSIIEIINEHGGVVKYLLSCGLTVNQVQEIKDKLIVI